MLLSEVDLRDAHLRPQRGHRIVASGLQLADGEIEQRAILEHHGFLHTYVLRRRNRRKQRQLEWGNFREHRLVAWRSVVIQLRETLARKLAVVEELVARGKLRVIRL